MNRPDMHSGKATAQAVSRVLVFSGYGGPETQEIIERPLPVPGRGEIAIEVKAAGVNPADWKMRAGLDVAQMVAKPDELSFADAAALPIAGATAYDLTHQIELEPGQTMLVESTGATFVASGEGAADRVRAIAPAGVDLVIDLVGGQPLRELAGVSKDPKVIITAADPATPPAR